MFKRIIAGELMASAREFPVVTVTGPRQSGKTTLVKDCFKDYQYANLEHPEVRALAIEDPNAFFLRYPPPLIIDEVQRVPSLLSYIMVKVDDSHKAGEYILTGSHQAHLEEAITQSLAGRTAILRLLPLSIEELGAGGAFARDECIYRGFMPSLHDKGMEPTRLYRSYFETYVQRDVRQMIQLKNLSVFEKFVRLLAGRVGQVVNFSSLSNDLGVSSNTVKEWISVLEASFIILSLPPFYENVGRRLIKSPKIYFCDVGLASYLLGIESAQMVGRDPLLGNLFENLVVMEAFKYFYNRGKAPQLFFYRDNKGVEMDLIHYRQRQMFPLEIKASMTWNASFSDNFRKIKKIFPESGRGAVIYAGELCPKHKDCEVFHFAKMTELFHSIEN